ncbi:MAG TPA: hypothetical protein VGJ05_03490 [Fimbriiglobus sp.]|jgi:hypothetical protein
MDVYQPVMTSVACRNCKSAKATRPRQLCFRCYYTPEVRNRFPSASKFGRRGVGNFCGNAPTPFAPTTAAPGSLEKLAVLEMRARLNQALWHPLDARYPGDPRTLQVLQLQKVA